MTKREQVNEWALMAQPRKEHEWLQKFIGEWTSEATMIMDPSKPAEKAKGTETVRSLGGLWIIAEGRGEMPEGGEMTMILTLGYDPHKTRYVGTFIASMMTHMWIYNGALDASGRILTLDTEGPDFSSGGRMTKFKDIHEVISDDHRTLTSQMLGSDGKWREVMTAHYYRKR